MIFYLGTHNPAWLANTSGVPLFVSAVRLRRLVRWPRATTPWALDSGGFSELSRHGTWTIEESRYVDEVERAQAEIGFMTWCAPQDWMCEPFITDLTRLDVHEHQRRTVASFVSLRRRLGAIVVPVIQGFEPAEYRRCVAMYSAEGFDLSRESVVGVGSVCRRQGTADAVRVLETIHDVAPGIRLHGFGFKTKGLELGGHLLASADSMAWSFDGRRAPPLDGCEHMNCANCRRYAFEWRSSLFRRLGHCSYPD